MPQNLAPISNAPDVPTKKYVDDAVATRLTPGQADAAYVNVSGDTMTGNLTVNGDLRSNYTHSVYGADMGGFKVTSVAAPTVANDAANKAYVDAKPIGITQAEADNRYLMLDGGIVEGNLTVMGELVAGTYLIASDVVVASSIEVPSPQSPDHAATKGYVDGALQVHSGPSAPTNPNVLLWIDTGA